MPSKYKYESRDLACANWMLGQIRFIAASFKRPNLHAWANDIRLMREQDQRSYDEIFQVFTWANKHEFWCFNILSPAKLRKQFDVLTIQMKKAAKPGAKTSQREQNLRAAVEMNYQDFIGKHATDKN